MPRSELRYLVDTLEGTHVYRELKQIVFFEEGIGTVQSFSSVQTEGMTESFTVNIDQPLPQEFYELERG